MGTILAFVDLLVGDLEPLGEHAIEQLTGTPKECHGDEIDVEHAVEHEDELGGAQVRVQRQAPRCVVHARARDAERIHLKDLLGVGSMTS